MQVSPLFAGAKRLVFLDKNRQPLNAEAREKVEKEIRRTEYQWKAEVDLDPLALRKDKHCRVLVFNDATGDHYSQYAELENECRVLADENNMIGHTTRMKMLRDMCKTAAKEPTTQQFEVVVNDDLSYRSQQIPLRPEATGWQRFLEYFKLL